MVKKIIDREAGPQNGGFKESLKEQSLFGHYDMIEMDSDEEILEVFLNI